MKKIVMLKSPTCGPCKSMEPLIAEICQQENIEFQVVSIIDENGRDFAEEVGARVVPTYALFEDEEMLKVSQGAKTKSQIEEWVKND